MVKSHRQSFLAGEPRDPFQDDALVLQVERGRRLVEDQYVGLRHQGPGEDHQLPLAAGQLMERPPREVRDAEAVEGRSDAFSSSAEG